MKRTKIGSEEAETSHWGGDLGQPPRKRHRLCPEMGISRKAVHPEEWEVPVQARRTEVTLMSHNSIICCRQESKHKARWKCLFRASRCTSGRQQLPSPFSVPMESLVTGLGERNRGKRINSYVWDGEGRQDRTGIFTQDHL